MRVLAIAVALVGCLPEPANYVTCEAMITCDGWGEYKLGRTCWYRDDLGTAEDEFRDLILGEARGRCSEVVLTELECYPDTDHQETCEP